MIMKYIVTKDEEGREEIFIFPKSVNHDCMMEVLQRIRDQAHGRWQRVHREAISAGFVGLDHDENNRLACYGRSETLHLASRGDQDSRLIDV